MAVVGKLAYAQRMSKSSTTAAVSWVELVARAQDVFGERLTAVILTGERKPALEAATDLMDRRKVDREALRVALEIAETLLALEAKTTIQAWFVGKNAMLDDRAPALVVRTDPDAVRGAARHFAAYG